MTVIRRLVVGVALVATMLLLVAGCAGAIFVLPLSPLIAIALLNDAGDQGALPSGPGRCASSRTCGTTPIGSTVAGW